MLVVSQIIGSLLQVLGVLLLSYLVYLLLGRPENKFRTWIGLEKTKIRWKYCLAIGSLYLILSTGPVIWLYSSHQMTTTNLLTTSYQATGFSPETVLVILFWATLQTSFSEEILFRACLRKLFVRFLGDRGGNCLQAFLFAFIHIFAVISYGFVPILLVFVMTFSVAYAMGWLVSKNQDGSILESWLIHATVNIISQPLILLFLS